MRDHTQEPRRRRRGRRWQRRWQQKYRVLRRRRNQRPIERPLDTPPQSKYEVGKGNVNPPLLQFLCLHQGGQPAGIEIQDGPALVLPRLWWVWSGACVKTARRGERWRTRAATCRSIMKVSSVSVSEEQKQRFNRNFPAQCLGKLRCVVRRVFRSSFRTKTISCPRGFPNRLGKNCYDPVRSPVAALAASSLSTPREY